MHGTEQSLKQLEVRFLRNQQVPQLERLGLAVSPDLGAPQKFFEHIPALFIGDATDLFRSQQIDLLMSVVELKEIEESRRVMLQNECQAPHSGAPTTFIHFPIRRNGAPQSIDRFMQTVRMIADIIENGGRAIIYSNTGLGRACLFAAAIAWQLSQKELAVNEAIELIQEVYSERALSSAAQLEFLRKLSSSNGSATQPTNLRPPNLKEEFEIEDEITNLTLQDAYDGPREHGIPASSESSKRNTKRQNPDRSRQSVIRKILRTSPWDLPTDESIFLKSLGNLDKVSTQELADVRQALSHYLRFHPDSPSVIIQIGKLELQWGQHLLEVESYLQALQVFYEFQQQHPESDAVLFPLANCYFQLGNYLKAKAVLTTHLNRMQDQAEAYRLLAMCHLNLGDLEDARLSCMMADDFEANNYFTNMLLGKIEMAMNKTGWAIYSFEWAHSDDPDRPEPLYNLGKCWRLLKKTENECAAYRGAWEINPQYTDAILALGTAFANKKIWSSEEKLDYLEDETEFDSLDPDHVLRYAFFNIYIGDDRKAEQQMRVLESLDSRYAALLSKFLA